LLPTVPVPPLVTTSPLPVPFHSTPVMFKLLKLPVESANTEAGKEPPVVGLIAIVKPVGVVDEHVVGEFVGGIVVFTMNMPSSRIGL
jgi:hypothetical protein